MTRIIIQILTTEEVYLPAFIIYQMSEKLNKLFIKSHSCNEYRDLTHPYKTGLYGEECLIFIYSSQESYLSDVGLNPTRVLASNNSIAKQKYLIDN